MVTELTSDGNPFRLSDGTGRLHTVSADDRVALGHLERTMFDARKTSQAMWKVGVLAAFAKFREHGAEGDGMRKRARMDYFGAGTLYV